MPKPIKKRIEKKAVIEEEEVKGIVTHALETIKERKKGLIYISSVVGVILILFVAGLIYLSSIKEKAYSFEKEAYSYYYNTNLNEEERWKKSLELFQKAIEIKSTPVVQFYIGNSYFNMRDYDNAVKAYLKFIDKYKNEEKILPLVYQKLASSYKELGKGDEVIKTLNDLAKFKNGIFKDTALILEAQYYESQGKSEEAIKRYKELVNSFPSSPWSVEAKAKIETQNQGLPIE